MFNYMWQTAIFVNISYVVHKSINGAVLGLPETWPFKIRLRPLNKIEKLQLKMHHPGSVKMNRNWPQRNRRSIRLKNYDYSGRGLYFITLCTANKINFFGHISTGEMHLNPIGKIVEEEWIKTVEIRKNISLGAYIIMPNHLHGILSIDFQINEGENNIGKFHSPSQTIGAIIRGFKGAATKRIHNFIRASNSTGELQFAQTNIAPTKFAPMKTAPTNLPFPLPETGSIWQRNYYENIIRTEKAYENISNYIINNPKNWEKDKFKETNSSKIIQ